MPRQGRDSPSATLSIDEILQHMADGWVMVAGKGVTNFGIYLYRGEEPKKSVARHQYALMRDAGYIAYDGIDAPLVLTVRGKRRAERLAAPSRAVSLG